MKKILVVGAGRSSASLIKYLLDYASGHDLTVTVADVSEDLARAKTGDHPKSVAIRFDVNNAEDRLTRVAEADVVVSLLPPHLHFLLALDCLRLEKHFITASYLSPGIKELDEEAKKKGLLFLNECGLDPGIDHMSAMDLFERLQSEGHQLTSFISYTGGLVAPESNDNPWGYKFSWNPRNVILAGQGTARYLKDSRYKYIPYNRLFSDIQTIKIEGLGSFDGYANRDSLSYRKHYGIENIPTILRGTLRQFGFCRAWNVFVRLGLTDDSYEVENSENLTYSELVRALLPGSYKEGSLEEDVAKFCDHPVEGEAMSMVTWTGIFKEEPIGIKSATPARILQHLLEEKWKLNPGDKDMIVMQHQVGFMKDDKPKTALSSLVVKGENQEHTAMAKTVGLPLGIATRLIVENKINLKGVLIPVDRQIYIPVLKELEQFGIRFTEEIPS